MIKGVNHRIVEITGMENDFFEKAVLYVRPDKSSVSQTRIDLEARSAVGKIVSKECKVVPTKKSRLNLTVCLVCASIILLTLTFILYMASQYSL